MKGRKSHKGAWVWSGARARVHTHSHALKRQGETNSMLVVVLFNVAQLNGTTVATSLYSAASCATRWLTCCIIYVLYVCMHIYVIISVYMRTYMCLCKHLIYLYK